MPCTPYPILAAIVIVVAAVVVAAAFRGSMSHLTMVLVLSVAVGLSGMVAGMAGVLCAATLAIACNYVFPQPVLDWPTGCTAKCRALAATAAGLFIKRRELRLLFARRVPA